MPAAAGLAPKDLTTTGDTAFYSPWTTAGLPSITIPTGISRDGMPIGVQLIGRGHDDAGLLRAARWVEERVAYTPELPPLAAAPRLGAGGGPLRRGAGGSDAGRPGRVRSGGEPEPGLAPGGALALGAPEPTRAAADPPIPD